jgi:hypothetical protein
VNPLWRFAGTVWMRTIGAWTRSVALGSIASARLGWLLSGRLRLTDHEGLIARGPPA